MVGADGAKKQHEKKIALLYTEGQQGQTAGGYTRDRCIRSVLS
jgi:hypothetical protein